MSTRSSDPPTCPVCGTEYDRRVVVERGDQWSDVFAGTAFSFFKTYRRRCTARRDVEADETLAENQRAVYFHDRSSY